MTTTISNVQNPAISTIRWLMEAGVSVEVAELPRDWLAVSSPQTSQTEPTPAPKVPTPAASYEKFNDINSLNEFLQQWKGLGITRTVTHTLLGVGPTQPELMLIADAPDAFEDQHGISFAGQGNRLISEAVRYAGFDDSVLYKTYLSKWRPPGQKALSPNEIATLAPLLEQEIVLVRPKAILVIGESVLKALGLELLRNPAPQQPFTLYINQELNYKIPLFASQKGEFLVKTSGMKKNFWLGLTQFTASLRAHGSPSVNYTE